jgi:hypothetical protein
MKGTGCGTSTCTCKSGELDNLVFVRGVGAMSAASRLCTLMHWRLSIHFSRMTMRAWLNTSSAIKGNK